MELECFKTSEAVVLLGLVAKQWTKARNTNQGRVEVHIDNKDIWRRINTTTRFPIHFNQDSTVEIIEIKELIKEKDLDVMLIRDQGHGEVRKSFHLNSGPKLTKMCDTKGKESRMNTETKVMNNNMRHYGEKVIVKDGKITSLLVKELIREVDAEEEEHN